MPFINKEDLLGFHKTIDKKEEELEKAKSQLKKRSSKLSELGKINNLFVGLTVLLTIGLLFQYFYTTSKSPSIATEQIAKAVKVPIQESKPTLVEVVEIAMPKEALKPIYSVQIGAFKSLNVEHLQESDMIEKVKIRDFYMYRVGKLPSYEKAQTLKEDLIKLGFQDAYIVSTFAGEEIPIAQAISLSNEKNS